MTIWERLPGHRTLSTDSPEGRKVIGKAVRIRGSWRCGDSWAGYKMMSRSWIRKAEWSSTHRQRLWKFPSPLLCGARHCLGGSAFTLSSDALKSGVDWGDVSVEKVLAIRAWRIQVLGSDPKNPTQSQTVASVYYSWAITARWELESENSQEAQGSEVLSWEVNKNRPVS